MLILPMPSLRMFCLAVASCLALVACDHEPRFDASSLSAYQRSLADIKARLSAKDQHKLQVALLTLSAGGAAQFTDYALSDPAKTDAYEALDGIANSLVLLDRMRPVIAGKTADEVIRRVGDDIDYAIARAEARGGAAKDLAAIVIENARYRLNDKIRSAPKGEFSVYNGSNIPIMRLYLTGELTAPDVKMPLVLDNIVYVFSRPLQPGAQEQATVYLGITGDWTTKHFLNAYDADLKLRVANVDDTDGHRLLVVSAQALETLRHKRDILRGG
jgi:hypothetical protein